MEPILIGTTDRTILVYIPDPASTDGSGKTGLAHTDMTVSYTRVETDNDVVVTDVTSSLNALTNLTDAHNDWGWKEVSSSLAPGLYRLDVADALFSSGAWYAILYVEITSSAAAATPKAFMLVAYNPLDGVRLGLTALPNAAAAASGGLIINGSNSGTVTLAALTVSGATTHTGNVSMAAGLTITQSSSNTSALVVTGNGTGHGALITSGSGATGDGLKCISVATLGNGINADGNGTTGAGILATAAYGFYALSDVANGHGFFGQGNTGGAGMLLYGGNNGDGLATQGYGVGGGAVFHGGDTAGPGVYAHGGATGPGFQTTGGDTSGSGFVISSTDGYGMQILSSGSGKHGIIISSGTNSSGMVVQGNGTYPGAYFIGGTTGHGVTVAGGSTSGDGINISTTDGNGITSAAAGTDKYGALFSNYSTGGFGLSCEGTKYGFYAYADDTSLGGGPFTLQGDGTGGSLITLIADSTAKAFNSTFIDGFFNVAGTAGYGTEADSLVDQIADNAGGSSLTESGIADAVWDELLSGHTTTGSAGKKLSDASAAGDPWSTSLPGAYSSGSAGYLIGTYVNASISAVKAKTDNLPSDPADASDIASSFSTVNSTLSTIAGYIDTEVAAILAAVDTEVAAIKAKTDNLPSDPADASDISSAFSTVNSTLSTISGYLDTEIAAIKAKTDNLPSDPADASDIAASFSTVNSTLSTIAGYIDTEVATIVTQTSAASIRSALGLASANLDTQLDALPTAAENAAALMDLSNGIETGVTPRQALRLILAAEAGKLSGAATTTITIRNVGDSKDRIVATVDAYGNRSALTLDAT